MISTAMFPHPTPIPIKSWTRIRYAIVARQNGHWVWFSRDGFAPDHATWCWKRGDGWAWLGNLAGAKKMLKWIKESLVIPGNPTSKECIVKITDTTESVVSEVV